MSEVFKDYFMILEVHHMASQGVIKSAYKQLCKTHHPDLGVDAEAFLDIREAYEVLSDKLLRRQYEAKWLRWHSAYMGGFEQTSLLSLFDAAFLPAREIVLEYMFFILHKDYEGAYSLLSVFNQKRIHKKDYAHWQSLIGEIHQLIEFDCAIESISQADRQGYEAYESAKSLIFKVKVKEKNLLLNRIEEEYFLRKVVYENGSWKIRLNDMDIKKIIKKYGRIIAINHKNNKKLKQLRPLLEEHYPTQHLSTAVFIKHCEYEFARFVRYHNPFVIIHMKFTRTLTQNKLEEQINDLLEKHTRKMDAFTRYEDRGYLMILPETDLEQGQWVAKKLGNLIETHSQLLKGNIESIQVVVAKKEYVSIKEMLEIVGL